MRTFPLSWSIALSATLLTACASDEFSSPTESSTAGQSGATAQAGSAGMSGQAGSGQGGQAGATAAGASGVGGAPSGGKAGVGGSSSGGVGGQGGAAACKPDTYKCLQNTLYICANDGSYKPEETCSPKVCDELVGACKECMPGQVVGCEDDTSLAVCDSTGSSTKPKACTGEMGFCHQGQCVECLADADCSSGAECKTAVCKNNVCTTKNAPAGTPSAKPASQECLERSCDGQGNAIEQNSLKGTACNAGVGFCNGQGVCGECNPDTVECASGGATRSCLPAGTWSTPKPCDETKPACSQSVCVGVRQMAAGKYHTCAVLEDGRVRCWGSNDHQNLGLDELTPTSRFNPSEVAGLENVVKVSAGYDFSCALTKDHQILCWGFNIDGETGTGGSFSDVTKPTPVKPPHAFTSLESKRYHSCAIDDQGKVFCWGSSYYKQAGECGDSSPCGEATLIALPSAVTAVALGDKHSCAWSTQKDQVYCWGANDQGQLGRGSVSEQEPKPAAVLGLKGILGIAAGDDGSVAWFLDEGAGAVNFANWGDHDVCNSDKSNSPVDSTFSVTKGTKIRYSRNYGHTIGTIGNALFVSGDNDKGMLGNPNLPAQECNTQALMSLSNVEDGTVGEDHTCAWQLNGAAWCWGTNSKGQLGLGEGVPKALQPTLVKW